MGLFGSRLGHEKAHTLAAIASRAPALRLRLANRREEIWLVC